MLQVWGPHLENRYPSSFHTQPKVDSPALSLERGLLFGSDFFTTLYVREAGGPIFQLGLGCGPGVWIPELDHLRLIPSPTSYYLGFPTSVLRASDLLPSSYRTVKPLAQHSTDNY